MPVPVLVWVGLGSIGGFIVGTLSRKPELSELKEQVKSLQAEVERLHTVIKNQNSYLSELKIRYAALKGWQLLQKNKQSKYIRGSIIYQYALKEYLEILIDSDQSNKVKMNKEEVRFYNGFGKILNNGEITDKDRKVVIDYITDRYAEEISQFKGPDLQSVIEYLE